MSYSKKKSKLNSQLYKGLKVCKNCNSLIINFQQYCSKCHKAEFIEDPEVIHKILLKIADREAESLE